MTDNKFFVSCQEFLNIFCLNYSLIFLMTVLSLLALLATSQDKLYVAWPMCSFFYDRSKRCPYSCTKNNRDVFCPVMDCDIHAIKLSHIISLGSDLCRCHLFHVRRNVLYTSCQCGVNSGCVTAPKGQPELRKWSQSLYLDFPFVENLS